MRQTLVGSVDLVEPVIVDVCDDHHLVGDAAHLLEGHAEVVHAATFRNRHLVLLWGLGAVLVDEENLDKSAEKVVMIVLNIYRAGRPICRKVLKIMF